MDPWTELNNRVLSGTQVNTRHDRDALRVYFQEKVNPNTVLFHDLGEKVRCLTEQGVWDRAVFERYSPQEVQAVFERAYSYRFRFQSFMGAYKFYSEYATRTPDGTRWLERYEDRMAVTALARSESAEEALELVHHLVTQTFTPATPTLMNSGKANTGRLVSCFAGDAMVQTINGLRRMDEIREGERVLTHDGSYKVVQGVMTRDNAEPMVRIKAMGNADPLVVTPEHPVLVLPYKRNPTRPSPLQGDGDGDGLQWMAAKDVLPRDYIVMAAYRGEAPIKSIFLSDYLNDASTRKWGRRVEERDGKVYLVSDSAKQTQRRGGETAVLNAKAVNATFALNEDFGKLLGLYVAEGYVHKDMRDGSPSIKGMCLTLNSEHTTVVEEALRLIREVVGLEPVVNVNADGSTNVNAWSGLFGEFLLNLIGSGYGGKRLPQFLVDGPEDFLRGFILGVYNGDGCMTENGSVMSLTNPYLVRQIQAMLMRIGIMPNAQDYISASGKVATNLKIPANSENHNALLMEMRDAHKLKPKGNTRRYFKWHVGMPLRLVSEVGQEEAVDTVYNLEVEDNHTYAVNGFIAHNCFLLQDCTDNLNSITKTLAFVAELSKGGGGIGVDASNLRARGESLRGIQNVTKGVMGVAKMLDNMLRYADQAGQRPGAGAVYLSVMHADFLELLNAKKIATDEDARLKTLSVGATIPDIFLEKVRSGEDIYQFYPHSLWQETGLAFTDIDWTRDYQTLADNPRIRKKRVSARRVLEDIAITQGESGYPYLLFEGNANRANPIPNVGTIKMSNLCSEILQPTLPSTFHAYGQEHRDQIGLDVSCNLASLVIEQTMGSRDIGRVVRAAVRLLDNVARSTSVPEVPAVRRANEEMRSIGLGAMGLHSFLAKSEIVYGSPEALEFVDVFFAAVHYHARRTSMEIARDTGFVFKGFEGSRYQSGEYFAQYLERDFLPQTPEVAALFAGHHLPTREDWRRLVADIQRHGLAHAFVMAVAPTGSISYISHASASIMPVTEKVETRTSNKARTIYPMPHLDETTEWYYEEAYDMDQRRVLDTVATAQKHVDQGISCTLFVPSTVTTRTLQRYYLYAYRRGLKTLYYTRLRKSHVQDCLSCVV